MVSAWGWRNKIEWLKVHTALAEDPSSDFIIICSSSSAFQDSQQLLALTGT